MTMDFQERRHSTAAAAEHWRTASPSGSERRKLSYHPVGEWVPPVAADEPITAVPVKKTTRITQVIIAVTYCLLAAGVVFGFAAIKPVLVAEGVYEELCSENDGDGKGVRVCFEQELRLNLMFTVAAVSTNVCALPVGTILDRFGPRIASIIGTIFLALGALSMAFAKDFKSGFDGYIVGYLFLALGGPFVFIPSFQLSNTFPKHSGLILALLTGAFDTSSAVFLAYRLIYQNTDGGLNLRTFFLIYLVVPASIFIAQVFIMPAQSYKTLGELLNEVDGPALDEHESDAAITDPMRRQQIQTARREHRESVVSEVTALLEHKSDRQKNAEEAKAARSGVWGALHGRTSWQQICTPWFVLITLFTVVQMVRINYFVATVRTQYLALLGNAAAAIRVNEFFDIALPLGGVIAVPFIGFVLDYTSTPFVLALLVVSATVIGILGIIPQMWAAYANVCLFVIYRPLYYTAVSDYSAKVFGFATFGRVYGLIICLAGLFNFTQQGLDALTHKTFGNDPVPVNVLLLSVAFIVGTALVAYVTRRSYMMGREKLEEEAERSREFQIPEAVQETAEEEQNFRGYTIS